MLSSNYRSKWKKTVCLCRHRSKIKGSKRILTSPKPSRQNLWNRGWIKKCPGRSKGTNFMSFNRVAIKKFFPWRLVSQKNSTTNPRGNSLGRNVRNSLFQRKKTRKNSPFGVTFKLKGKTMRRNHNKITISIAYNYKIKSF